MRPVYILSAIITAILSGVVGAEAVGEPSCEAVLVNNAQQPISSAAQAVRMIQEATAEGSAPGLHVALLPHAATQPSAEQILGGVNAWLAVNAESISGASPVPGVTLPIGWLCTIVGEDTYVHAPALSPSSDVVTLRVPAHQIDTVIPETLGQPRCKITVKRVEEPGEDEPHAFMEFRIPATAWKEAPLGLPVIKLINAQ